MKKCLKICLVVLEILFFLMILNNISIAVTEQNEEDDTSITSATGWNSDNSVTSATKNTVGVAVKIIKMVGYGIAVIMLIYIGIKYMSAAPSEKAEFKKSATAYVVGAVVLLGATKVITIIANFATANLK